MRKYVLDINADNMLAEACRNYIESGKLGSAFEVEGSKVNLSLADLTDAQPGIDLCALGKDRQGEDIIYQALDEFGMPKPHDYDGPSFSALAYFSEEYEQAENLNEAIKLRGFKAFLDMVEPSDFSDDLPGVYRIGFAQLWSQSTWEDGLSDRNVEHEQAALSIENGDLLTIRPLGVASFPIDSQDLLEVRDLGFAFFKGDTMLPYTPYHDYDQDLLINGLLSLNKDELIACLVRSNDCTGGDGVPADEDFCWRVYTPTVEVLKLDMRS